MSGLELLQPLSASGGFAPKVPPEDPSKTVYALVKIDGDNQPAQSEQAEHSSYDKSRHDIHRARQSDLETDSKSNSTTSQQVIAAKDSCDDGSSAAGSSSTGPTSNGSATSTTSSWDSIRGGSSTSSTTSSMQAPKNLWACPFFVRALTLGEHGQEPCQGYRRIGDIRQHIYRRHLQPPHCPSCGCIFTTRQAQNLQEHINQGKCTQIAFELPGVTQDQWADICARGRAAPHTVNGGDVERWYQIWDVLFPGVGRPASPFMHGSVFTMRSRGFAQRFLNSHKGWERIGEMFPTMATEQESNRHFLQGLHDLLEDSLQSYISFIEEEEDRSNYHSRTAPP